MLFFEWENNFELYGWPGMRPLSASLHPHRSFFFAIWLSFYLDWHAISKILSIFAKKINNY